MSATSATISHTAIAPGVYHLETAEVFAVESSDGLRVYSVVIADGRGTCSCPSHQSHCRHVRQVLAARAGF